MRNVLAILFAATAITGATGSALAQTPGDSARCANASNTGEGSRDQTYCFSGEDVRSGLVGHDGQDVRLIRPLHGPSLLRFRAHFVPEMLKSVELL